MAKEIDEKLCKKAFNMTVNIGVAGFLLIPVIIIVYMVAHITHSPVAWGVVTVLFIVEIIGTVVSMFYNARWRWYKQSLTNKS